MTKEEMKTRTKSFAIAVFKFTDTIGKGRASDIVSRQLIRSATSVGANYRASLCAKSPADFVAKLAIALEEADESQYWIEILIETGFASREPGQALWKEATQITAILSASLKTARSNINRSGAVR